GGGGGAGGGGGGRGGPRRGRAVWAGAAYGGAGVRPGASAGAAADSAADSAAPEVGRRREPPLRSRRRVRPERNRAGWVVPAGGLAEGVSGAGAAALGAQPALPERHARLVPRALSAFPSRAARQLGAAGRADRGGHRRFSSR